MAAEVIELLQPARGGKYFDGTLGAGGHARLIMQASNENILYATDRDPQALSIAEEFLAEFAGRLHVARGSFDEAPELFEDCPSFDGILVDLGLSSMQIDDAARGFSFSGDGPLDMRADSESDRTAAEIVNSAPAEEIERILREYGEERAARTIARRIVAARQQQPIETTSRLASIVRAAYGPRANSLKIHPATRTFQALRIEVNDELRRLARFLDRLPEMAAADCRVCVISFHSLEDRLVKESFRNYSRACICPTHQPVCTCRGKPLAELLTKKPAGATEQEIRDNPRARSAKLRAIRWLSN